MKLVNIGLTLKTRSNPGYRFTVETDDGHGSENCAGIGDSFRENVRSKGPLESDALAGYQGRMKTDGRRRVPRADKTRRAATATAPL